jgi:hypothetical protein
MLGRLEQAQRWLRAPSTELLLVAAVRDDAAHAAGEIAAALAVEGLRPRAAVVNRALPAALLAEMDALGGVSLGAEAEALLRYARAQAAIERRVVEGVAALAPAVVVVPAARGLDEEGRLEALAALGERLRGALAKRKPSGEAA